MNILSLHLLRLTWNVIKWLVVSVYPQLSGTLVRINLFLFKLEKIAKSRGFRYMILHLKDVRTVFFNYLAGHPIKLKGVKVTSDGIPQIFGDLIQDIRRGESPFVQILNTVLFCGRSTFLSSKDLVVDTTPIVSGLKCEYPESVGKWIPEF